MTPYNKSLEDGKIRIEKQLRHDKEKYKADKQAFYADPKHWDNNKRKRAGFCTLRSDYNKDRNKKFRCFRMSRELFEIVDDVVNKCLLDKCNEGLFNSFVEAKNLKNDDMEGECTYEASSIF